MTTCINIVLIDQNTSDMDPLYIDLVDVLIVNNCMSVMYSVEVENFTGTN